jgi:DNA polymerase I-like protein with 3'-5' exonuclease and polymerase domains
MAVYSYDYFVNKDNISLEKERFVFAFLNKNILYLKSGQKIISVNLESIYFATGEIKSFLTTLFKDKVIVFPNYKSAKKIFTAELLHNTVFLENFIRLKNDSKDLGELMSQKIKEEKYFDILSELETAFNSLSKLNDEEKRCYKNLLIKDVATSILSNSYLFLNVPHKNFEEKSSGLFAKKISYSNKRTLTGRITCTDNFNIQMMPKNDPIRKNIVSRFNRGSLINFDYSSFETILSMHLTKNKDFIQKYLEKDIHEETAKIIFNKDIVLKQERDFAKKINHSIVYGAGKNAIIESLNSFSNPENTYNTIIQILKPILDSKISIVSEFKNKKYIKNYFGTFVFPQKEHAIYNNYIQSTAADIIAKKIIEIHNLLLKFNSKITTSIIDSIVVDIHPDEDFLIEKIVQIMSRIDNFELKISFEKI